MPNDRNPYIGESPATLFARAHFALAMTHGKLGEALGVSERTVSRWHQRGPSLSERQFAALARLVYPRDPALAAALAREAKESLESLGIVAPPPVAPPPSPQQGALPVTAVIDAVVCAAAEALDLPPGPVRSAVRAAFRRARELRLTVEDVDSALAPAPAAKSPAGSVP